MIRDALEQLVAIIGYTLKQHLRHRVYLTIILFGLILFGGALVLSPLAAEERSRLLLDLGLAAIEFLALIAVVFVTVGLVLDEVESRTIYLVLTRPVSRAVFITGRFLGTLAAIGAGMALMAALHAALLLLYGEEISALYAIAWLCALGKIAVVGALALFFSLFSTSATASMAFTLFLWVLGHFSEELVFLGEKSDNAFLRLMVSLIHHLAPNFSYFNYRDFLGAVPLPSLAWLGWMALYALCYAGICLYISCFLFSEREF